MSTLGTAGRMAATLGVAVMLLGGCSGLKSSAAVTQIYLLQPPAASAQAAGTAVAGDGALTVLLPVVAPGLASERIALTRPDGRLDYFGASRWAGELPEVLQTLAIDALRSGGRFAGVQSDATPASGDFALQIEARHFEAQYPGDDANGATAPTAQVTLVCTLIRRVDRGVIASFTAAGSASAGANRMGAVIEAFDRALGQALQQLQEQVRPLASATP